MQWGAWAAAGLIWLWSALPLQAATCDNTLGPARVVSVPSEPADYGTLQYARTLDLDQKEVVLTFDDGPDPDVTPRILDTLDAHCLKATFFFTGHRAERYPHLVREAARRGHTIASHSYSHPNNLRRLSWSRATRQIQRGIDEIQAALDGEGEAGRYTVAPFFRFPGLNDSTGLRGWLAARDISTFSCDFGSDDWRRISASSVVQRSLRNIAYKGKGIIIFHDTKSRTAAALPYILDSLKARGYTIAHMVPEGTDSGDQYAELRPATEDTEPPLETTLQVSVD